MYKCVSPLDGHRKLGLLNQLEEEEEREIRKERMERSDHVWPAMCLAWFLSGLN